MSQIAAAVRNNHVVCSSQLQGYCKQQCQCLLIGAGAAACAVLQQKVHGLNSTRDLSAAAMA